MLNVFKKVMMTAACMLLIQAVYAEETTANSTPNNLSSQETKVCANDAASPVVVAKELASQKFLLTYKINGRVYYQKSVTFGTVIKTIDAPVKKGFVFSGWNEAPATMPAQNVVINGTLVAADQAQESTSDLLAKK